MKQAFGNLSGTAKVMLGALGCLFVVLLLIGLLISLFLYPFERPLPYGVGLLLGHLLSAIKLVLMDRSIGKSLDMQEGQARNYANLQVVLRYFLTILFLLGGVFLPRYIGLFGLVLGILSLQFSAYVANAYLKNKDHLI